MRGYGNGYGAGDGWGRGYNYSARLTGGPVRLRALRLRTGRTGSSGRGSAG